MTFYREIQHIHSCNTHGESNIAAAQSDGGCDYLIEISLLSDSRQSELERQETGRLHPIGPFTRSLSSLIKSYRMSSKTVLVAVDGSKYGDWAYHAAVHSLNPATDNLLLVSVAHVTPLDSLSVIKAALTQGKSN